MSNYLKVNKRKLNFNWCIIYSPFFQEKKIKMNLLIKIILNLQRIIITIKYIIEIYILLYFIIFN